MTQRVVEMTLLCLMDMLVQKISLKVNPCVKVLLKSRMFFSKMATEMEMQLQT